MPLAVNFAQEEGGGTSLLGHVVRSEKIAGHTLSTVIYGANSRIAPHTHNAACFALVLHGTQTESFGSKTIECGARQAFYRPSDVWHEDKFRETGATCFAFEVSPSWIGRLQEYSNILEEPELLTGRRTVEIVNRLYQEWAKPDGVTPLMVEGLSLELAAEWIRDRDSTRDRRLPPWLRRVFDFIHERAAQPWSLAELAALAGVHPMHLAREFRRCYGMSVGQLVRQRRTELACDLLRTTDLPLVQVAIASGFASQSHLTTVLKRIAGTTPASYRERMCLR